MVEILVAAATGAGAILFRNWRVARKIQKVDFADKAVNFMAGQNDRLMKRVDKLESDVAKLMVFKCEKVECKNRIPPRL